MNKLFITCLTLFTLFFLSSALAEEPSSPSLSIQAAPSSGPAPLTVAFSLPADLSADSYQWDFTSDGTIDSDESSPSYTYPSPGTYLVTLNSSLGQATKEILVQNGLVVSAVANPTGGQAPLVVQFTAVATGGQAPLSYSWDFNNDGVLDSTQQNPSHTFSQAGEYQVALVVTDSQNSQIKESILLSVTKYDSHLNLTSCFPTKLSLGENQLSCIILNEGTEPVNNLAGKLVGNGLQHLTSTSIPTLNPNDQDSFTLKINVLQTGTLTSILKIADKNFPLQLEVVPQVQYSKEELQTEFAQFKEKLKEQEAIYYDKKAQGYPTNEVFESLKAIQKQVQDTQQQLLTNKLAEARINLDLLNAALTDFTDDLQKIKKQKVTFLLWMKENALAITAIIAALGTLSGILIKVLHQAKKVKGHAQKLGEKIGEDLKKKFPLRKEHHKASPLPEPSPSEEVRKEIKEEIKEDFSPEIKEEKKAEEKAEEKKE